MAAVRVAALDDIAVGSNRAFDIAGQSVLIARTSFGLFAIENQCSHALQALEGGKMKAVHIFCPLHGVRFDMRDGCPTGTLTDKPIRTWPVRIADGDILVDLGNA
ncbi:Rieske (2Fe-2S) protein [Sphingomonas sp. 28-63-12]|uniref:Rieske (2Fe-2S) protein n=1 Tax=Sphingomonas sp. 28-63-12 TaxID=1970434 RepID=UPI000BDA3A36|nr:MAG: ferredoxin [Sphingomonas sp. 28-63-12]